MTSNTIVIVPEPGLRSASDTENGRRSMNMPGGAAWISTNCPARTPRAIRGATRTSSA
jgi:hypothetical protein